VDRGDFEALGSVLREAELDAELDRRLAGVNTALHAEAGLPSVEEQAQLVRQLLLRYLPSARPLQEPAEPPLCVQDVAARLESDLAIAPAITASDRLANRRLLECPDPLPATVTTASVTDLAARLGIEASARYWERFRRAAIMLGITRQRGANQLAAARRQTSRGRPRAPRPERKPKA
jgi:hypothetical protein